MKCFVLLSLLATLLSVAGSENLIRNGEFSKKTTWKYRVGSYEKDKGNQFMRLKASKGYESALNQRVKLTSGTYNYSFKIRGHQDASISVTVAPSAYYWHNKRVFGSTAFDKVAKQNWSEVKGTITVPDKYYKYFNIWLYTPSSHNRNKSYYAEIDDVVLTKK